MRTEDFNEILSMIEGATTKAELEEVKANVVSELDSQVASDTKEIEKLMKLTNPSTFIAKMIEMILESITQKTKDKAELVSQTAKIKEAYETKLNTF